MKRPPKIEAYGLMLVYTEVYSFSICFGTKGRLNQVHLKFLIIFYDFLYTVACNWIQEKVHFLKYQKEKNREIITSFVTVLMTPEKTD